MDLPREIYDIIISYLGKPVPIDDRRYIRLPESFPEYSPGQLAILRLVNKNFCRSASIPFFRYLNVRLRWNHQENAWPLDRLVGIARSQNAQYVRHLVVGFGTNWRPEPAYERYIDELATLLPECLGKFNNITHFGISAPPFYTSQLLDPSFSPDVMRKFTRATVNVLFNNPLPKLKHLVVTLPLTCEFGEFFAIQPTASTISIQNIIKPVQELDIEITDNTGEGGCRDYFADASAIKIMFPNEDYQSHVFRFIELAEDLRFFSLTATDFLNLDGLDLGNMTRIHTLQLTRVRISAERLLALVERCKDTLSRITFRQVELNSGRWHEVLQSISQFELLKFFFIEEAGYSATGASADVYFQLNNIEATIDIETKDFQDYHAMVRVQKRVNANREAVGLPGLSK